MREIERERDVSDSLCLLDSHRFSFVFRGESRQRAISSLSHLDHGQVVSSEPLSRAPPPVSDTLPVLGTRTRESVYQRKTAIFQSQPCEVSFDTLGFHKKGVLMPVRVCRGNDVLWLYDCMSWRKKEWFLKKTRKSLNVGHCSLWQLISPHSFADGRGFRELASLLTRAV